VISRFPAPVPAPGAKLKKRIMESESLRFGSAAIWNSFLQTYRQAGIAKRGETDFHL
jgi:hypothetical protein